MGHNCTSSASPMGVEKSTTHSTMPCYLISIVQSSNYYLFLNTGHIVCHAGTTSQLLKEVQHLHCTFKSTLQIVAVLREYSILSDYLLCCPQ